MPAIISHYLLAARVLKSLEKDYNIIVPNHPAFILGSSGPDIFFGHRVMPWEKGKSLAKVSHIMHASDASDMLNIMAEYARQNNDDVALSYVYGFATHYAFDSSAHPYIVGRSDAWAMGRKADIGIFSRVHPKVSDGVQLSSIYHNLLESELDSVYLMKERRIPIRFFRMMQTVPVSDEIVGSCALALCAYIGASGIYTKPDRKEVIRAFYDWKRCVWLMGDRLTLKKALIRRAERILGLPPALSVFFRSCEIDYDRDCANISHKDWYSPADGQMHNETFFDLADRAYDQSVRLITKLHNCEALEHSDCRESFSGH